MTQLGNARHLIGLSVVLAVYWVPVVMGVGWGIWSGGDPISIAASVSDSVAQEWITLPTRTVPLAPLIIGATIVALVHLRRSAPRPRAEVIADKLTVALALPYLAIGLYLVAFLAWFYIACKLAPCNFLF
jgi:hypothetical protein